MEPPPPPPPPPPHLVVFPFPAQGHVNPAFHFSQHLASRGLCLITFLNIHHYISKLQDRTHSLSLRFFSLPLELPEAEAGGTDLPRLAAATEKMGGVLEDLLVRLLDTDTCQAQGQVRWPPPVCLVTDVFLGWVQDVADKLRLPRFILFTPPAATLMVMLHVPEMVSNGRLPYTKRRSSAEGEVEEDADLVNLPGVTPKVRITDIPSHLILDPSAFMYGYFIRHCRRIPDAAGLLLNTFHELEAPAIDAAQAFLRETPGALSKSHIAAEIEEPRMPRRVLPVGPLLPSDFFERSGSDIVRAPASEDQRCLQWLDTQSPSSIIYVSFGSIAALSDAQIHELALGLEASGHPFLWVVRPENPSATVEDVLPTDFLSRATGRGLVVSWAPQLEILSHPSTAFFLSHCGWNSTLESICSGVALLCWPMFAEQKMNCRFLVDEVKVGLEFSRAGEDGVVVRNEVERVVRLAMETEEGNGMKRRVGELRDVSKKVVSDGGSSFQNLLHHFVQLVSSL